MTESSPSVCTDVSLATEICSSVGYQRECALKKFVTGSFQYVAGALRKYTYRKGWNCSGESIMDACTDAYAAFKKNTGAPGFRFQKVDMCGYFFKIALRNIYQQFKGRKNQMETYDDLPHEPAETATPHTLMEDREQYGKLESLIQQLHPEDQEIFACLAEHYKIIEIALHMQQNYKRIARETKKRELKSADKHLWKEPYTKIRVQRARQKLLDLLSDNF